MESRAAYDAHADWYDHYVHDTAPAYFDRVRATLRTLLGPGAGPCLDVCCGTGAHAQTVRDLGWTPLGVDLSHGQLRHATTRLPVARADATALPVASRSVPAAVCVLAHTDVPDYPAVLAEIARTLRPGARLVHVGVHPCFVGAFANRADPTRVVLDPRYTDPSHTFDAWCPTGVRARLGAWHLPLAPLLNAFPAAGLTVLTATESGPTPTSVPDLSGSSPNGSSRPYPQYRAGSRSVEIGPGAISVVGSQRGSPLAVSPRWNRHIDRISAASIRRTSRPRQPGTRRRASG